MRGDRVLIGMMLAATALGCSPSRDTATLQTAGLADSLQATMDRTLATGVVPGVTVRVEAPSVGFEWERSIGAFDKATGKALEPSHLVRIASNTKTYIAAAVLRLAEEGKVALDSSAGRYLAPASVEMLRRGGYDPDAITVAQLLTHTSGIFDYAMAPGYFAAVAGRFDRRWTRAEQLAFAVDSGKPVGAPGDKYHYSDTGYILLGELIERASGQPMGRAVRDLLHFDRLGIRYTYFETLDSVPAAAPERVHQYLDSTDTYTLDASHDLYGGGGLLANPKELAIFYRALVQGEIFDHRGTLDRMLTMTSQSQQARPDGGYGMGIGRADIDGVACYGHSGYWGTVARHCPSIDLTLVVTVNRSPDSAGTLGKLGRTVTELMVAAVDTSRRTRKL